MWIIDFIMALLGWMALVYFIDIQRDGKIDLPHQQIEFPFQRLYEKLFKD